MASVYDNLQPGNSVKWRGLNRDYTGTVLRLTPRGCLVRLDGSEKHTLLSTSDNLKKKTK